MTAKTALALDKDLSGKVWEQSFNDVRLTDEEAKLWGKEAKMSGKEAKLWGKEGFLRQP